MNVSHAALFTESSPPSKGEYGEAGRGYVDPA